MTLVGFFISQGKGSDPGLTEKVNIQSGTDTPLLSMVRFLAEKFTSQKQKIVFWLKKFAH